MQRTALQTAAPLLRKTKPCLYELLRPIRPINRPGSRAGRSGPSCLQQASEMLTLISTVLHGWTGRGGPPCLHHTGCGDSRQWKAASPQARRQSWLAHGRAPAATGGRGLGSGGRAGPARGQEPLFHRQRPAPSHATGKQLSGVPVLCARERKRGMARVALLMAPRITSAPGTCTGRRSGPAGGQTRSKDEPQASGRWACGAHNARSKARHRGTVGGSGWGGRHGGSPWLPPWDAPR